MRRLMTYLVAAGLVTMMSMMASEALAACYRCVSPGGIPTCWLQNGTRVNCGLNNGRCYVWGSTCGSGVIVPEYPDIDSSILKRCGSLPEPEQAPQPEPTTVPSLESSEPSADS